MRRGFEGREESKDRILAGPIAVVAGREVWDREGDFFTVLAFPIFLDGFFCSCHIFEGFPGSFMLWVSFPVDQEMSLISLGFITNNLFHNPFWFSFDGDRVWSAVALAGEHVVIRRGVFLKVLSGDPWVNMSHAIIEIQFVVVIGIRSFKNIEGSKPWAGDLLLAINGAKVRCREDKGFVLPRGKRGRWLESIFAEPSLSCSGDFEGVSGFLVYLHEGRGKGISCWNRGGGDSRCWEEVWLSAIDNFEGGVFGAVSWC